MLPRTKILKNDHHSPHHSRNCGCDHKWSFLQISKIINFGNGPNNPYSKGGKVLWDQGKSCVKTVQDFSGHFWDRYWDELPVGQGLHLFVTLYLLKLFCRTGLLSCQPGPDLVDLVLAMALIIKHVDVSFMLIMHQIRYSWPKKWKKISWEACPYRPSRAGSWFAFSYSFLPNNTNAMAAPLSHLCHN